MSSPRGSLPRGYRHSDDSQDHEVIPPHQFCPACLKSKPASMLYAGVSLTIIAMLFAVGVWSLQIDWQMAEEYTRKGFVILGNVVLLGIAGGLGYGVFRLLKTYCDPTDQDHNNPRVMLIITLLSALFIMAITGFIWAFNGTVEYVTCPAGHLVISICN